MEGHFILSGFKLLRGSDGESVSGLFKSCYFFPPSLAHVQYGKMQEMLGSGRGFFWVKSTCCDLTEEFCVHDPVRNY